MRQPASRFRRYRAWSKRQPGAPPVSGCPRLLRFFASPRSQPRPRWSVDLHAPVEWSGPAVGPDGTVYVGTSIGTFYGIRPDGIGRCGWSFAGATFVSTPAILPDGSVAMLLHRKEGDLKQAELILISPDCKPIWNRELPRESQNFTSLASGSVKVWTNPSGRTFLFVHSRGNRIIDLTRKETNTGNEILVYDTAGELFARNPTGSGCAALHGGGIDFGLGDVWNFFSGLWPTVGELPPLYEQFGWPDPSPALLDSTLRGFSTATQPLVAVTDHDCNAELNVYQFRPEAATVEGRLIRTWTTTVDSRGTLLSSPALLPEGKVVIGSSTNRLRVYDLLAHPLQNERFRTTSPALTQNGGLYVVSQTEYNSFLFAFGDP